MASVKITLELRHLKLSHQIWFERWVFWRWMGKSFFWAGKTRCSEQTAPHPRSHLVLTNIASLRVMGHLGSRMSPTSFTFIPCSILFLFVPLLLKIICICLSSVSLAWSKQCKTGLLCWHPLEYCLAPSSSSNTSWLIKLKLLFACLFSL